MPDDPPRSLRPAPEWATRLLFAFVILSLGALIVVPWTIDSQYAPIQTRMNRITDDGRRIVVIFSFTGENGARPIAAWERE